jgi:DNA modification methylase
MKIRQIPIESLHFSEFNPRKISQTELDALKKSLSEFGIVEPAVVNVHPKRMNIVVGGHQRLRAAQELGWTTFPCFEVSLTKERERELNIRLNRNVGQWDFNLLKENFDATDLLNWGFTEQELDVAGLLSTDGIVEDEAPPPPEHPKTQPGDFYVIGRHRLLCGDATKAEDVSRLLGQEKPALMVTDPPYGVDYDPHWRAAVGINKNKKKMGRVTNDACVDWREAWVLFPGDIAYVWHAGRFASIVQKGLEESGFLVVSQIVWAKDRFALSRGDYHWQHEPCWYAVQKGMTHAWTGDRKQTTLWSIPRADDKGHGHGTQKPVECMARPIRNNSSPGQAVYDPFLGSGTTVIAAEQLGRSCQGLEIEPKYCDVVVTRWVNFTGKVDIELNGKKIKWHGPA